MNNNLECVDCQLLKNIHEQLKKPPEESANEISVLELVKGDYLYYHYGCDGFDDRGWGCGYRTLQTLCSWLKFQRDCPELVPPLDGIQESLVDMNDKAPSFIGSKTWIGSIEVAMCVDYFYDTSCKIVHIKQGSDLKNFLPTIINHFEKYGCPIMMGGDSDNASKGILGVCQSKENAYLLVLDPHYYGPNQSPRELTESGFLCWRSLESFMPNSFYNLCLVQLKASEIK
ncbi:DgyrCDS282 [Dimorphilus gyrociliatus]|uniref:DgyrCDS282 n=1 Tax=Dimorphilus gyrociliatus TaxID=2664684 RepID=A0A7I8V493_9ANNE|nr:DgyrCDS282 [Dimorphilus gyrociliatus]